MPQTRFSPLLCFLLAAATLAAAQPGKASSRHQAASEDISGMYSFLREGEFVQINVEPDGVSGYISRQGDQESDRGVFLDQFFDKAAITGHDLTFTTRPLHGVVFNFKGRYERGPAKSKVQDGYYVLRGTLTEFITDGDRKTTSRSRQVEFKLLGQPADDGEQSKDNKDKD